MSDPVKGYIVLIMLYIFIVGPVVASLRSSITCDVHYNDYVEHNIGGITTGLWLVLGGSILFCVFFVFFYAMELIGVPLV